MTHSKQRQAIYQKLPLTSGNSFVVNRYTSPQFETPWHFHQEYELVYCESSFGTKFIGNSFSDYMQGDLFFIGKNVPHLFKADDSFYKPEATVKPGSVVIQFLEDFMGTRFFNSAEMSEMKGVLALSMNGLHIVGKTKEKIKDLMLQMVVAQKTTRLSHLVEIFGLLSSSADLQPLGLTTVSGINANDSLKMQKVLDYALTNYKEDIRIGEAARLVNLSEPAFCRYFKSRTQKSFLAFVIEMRLNEARKLLRDTDKSVLEICYDSGFKNLSNFNRLFKKQFGKNPLEDRKS